MKIMFVLALCSISVVAAPMHSQQMQRKDMSAGCISKYYNKDLGPLEILMMPLGEKLWLRAWLGMHMSNLLHMEGVDLAEVSGAETDRNKRSAQVLEPENENKIKHTNLESVAAYSYHLSLQLLQKDALFQNEVQINITCLHSTNSITLYAHSDLKVNDLSIRQLDFGNLSNHESLQSEQEHNHMEQIEVVKLVWSEKESLCEIYFQETLVKGAQYQIDIKYHVPITEKNEGIMFQKYKDSDFDESSWFIGINLKHENIMKIIPSFQGSKYKAAFKINIVHPENMTAISSSPLVMQEQVSNLSGWIRSNFKVTPPMTPSSLSMIILNPFHFEQVSATTDGGVIIQGYIWNHDIAEFHDTIDYLTSAVNFLERVLGVPFPAPQLNIIYLPNMNQSAVDFWGMIYARTDVSPSTLLFSVLKQWFGHFVTAENANEEYVTSSLAYYYAYFCSLGMDDECKGGSRLTSVYHTDFITLLDLKERMSTKDFRDHKMVLFLRMLNYSLSENSFQRGIQIFLKYRSYSTFVEEDLWDALDIQAWSDGTLDRTISTKDISIGWLSQDLLPLVIITTDPENGTITVEQQIFVRHWPYTIRDQDNLLWQIPISFTTENDIKEGKPGTLFWLKEKTIIVDYIHDFGAYYIGNYNNMGMYMVSYEDSNWKALGENLLSDGMNTTFTIPTKTRASLLRNAWYLAVAGQLDFTLALNMTLFLKYERDPFVWKTFAEVYFMVAWKLVGTGVEIKFDQFIGELLVPTYENANHNDTELKALAYFILCKAGYEPAIELARSDFNNWLETHQEINHGVIGGVVRWFDEDWERGLQHVLHLLKDGKLPKVRSFLLSQLAGSPIQEKTEKLLSVLLTNPKYVFSKAEIMNVLPSISRCKTFLEFLTSHWDAVKERYASEPNMWQYIMEQAAKKCKTPDDVNRIDKFYKTHQNDLGISGNSLKHNIEITRRKMDMVYHQIPEFEDALNQFLNNLL